MALDRDPDHFEQNREHQIYCLVTRMNRTKERWKEAKERRAHLMMAVAAMLDLAWCDVAYQQELTVLIAAVKVFLLSLMAIVAMIGIVTAVFAVMVRIGIGNFYLDLARCTSNNSHH